VNSETSKLSFKTPEGKYLAGSGINPCLVEARSRAIVLDYFADRVEHKITIIQENSGIVFRPVSLPPTEVYETCDGCKSLVMHAMHSLTAVSSSALTARPRRMLSRKLSDWRHRLHKDCANPMRSRTPEVGSVISRLGQQGE
jgi:hypothetical protein